MSYKAIPVLFFCFLLNIGFSTAQVVARCNSDHHQETLLKDENYKKQFNQRLERFLEISQPAVSARTNGESIILPIAVHFQSINNYDKECLRELVIRQIGQLNADFKAISADAWKWESDSLNFPNTTWGKSDLHFSVAKYKHPAGYGLNDGDMAITINQVQGDTAVDWKNYLNIFVRPLDAVGRAPFGGSGYGDGIFVGLTSFGVGVDCGDVAPTAPFDKGRTVVHEIGHYLFLNHIWGKGCEHDDDVLDTPDADGPKYGCPPSFLRSCGSVDMHINFMDYTNDQCMYLFTKGQVERMENYAIANLNHVCENADRVLKKGNSSSTQPENLVCPVPTDFRFEYAEENLTISWKPEEIHQLFLLKYKTAGATEWDEAAIKDSIFILENALPNEQYEFKIKAYCNSTETTWLEANFLTESEPQRDKTLQLNSYPNPFNERLTIAGRFPFFLEDEIVTVKIFDINGKLVKSTHRLIAYSYNYFDVPIETESLPTGYYIIECELANVKKRLKAVKFK